MGAERSASRRTYRSARRQEQAAQTRALVLAAAASRFAASGWAGTGMRDVARDAGVAVETVYASFGSKPDLLRAALQQAVVGDSQPVPLAGRPEFAVLGEGGLARRAAAAASLLTQIHLRTADLQIALREAAAADAGLAGQLREDEERRRLDVQQGATLVARRPVSDQERDGLWAIVGPDVFRSLTALSGWTAVQYQDWLADLLVRLLGPADSGVPPEVAG